MLLASFVVRLLSSKSSMYMEEPGLTSMMYWPADVQFIMRVTFLKVKLALFETVRFPLSIIVSLLLMVSVVMFQSPFM